MSHTHARLVADARKEVQQVQDWLLRPAAETMSACVPALERATASLIDLSRSIPPAGAPSALPAAVAALADEIRKTQILFTAAGALYFGSLRRLTSPAVSDPQPDEPSPPLSLVG